VAAGEDQAQTVVRDRVGRVVHVGIVGFVGLYEQG
jgi:hypothetical protein